LNLPAFAGPASGRAKRKIFTYIVLPAYYHKFLYDELMTLASKLIKIGAKVVKHARFVTFQMAEVMVSKALFEEILERIHQLKPAGIGYG